MVATNDVHYHHPVRRELQDVLTCIREKCTIHTAGFKLHPNAERHLKPIAEMQRLFRQYPDAIRRTQEIAEACQFSLDMLKYEYPVELTSEGRTPQQELEYLTLEGAIEKFGEDLPEKILNVISHELNFIKKMNYASYFLTVHDIVRFARVSTFFARAVDPLPIPLFVFAWALPLSIPINSIYYSNGLFLRHAMSPLILMWILNTSGVKK